MANLKTNAERLTGSLAQAGVLPRGTPRRILEVHLPSEPYQYPRLPQAAKTLSASGRQRSGTLTIKHKRKMNNNKIAMRKTVITLTVLMLIASSCGQRTTKQTEIANNKSACKQKEENTQGKNEQFDKQNKFLITNNSVGYFNIGDSWQNLAENEYHYQYIQGYGSCIDACCNGGFDLGNGIMTIGTLSFENSESFDDETEGNKYKSNPNVFYVSSENCRGWYWKDKISFIIIQSDLFKTKEGIGVNTTLEESQNKLGKLVFNVGWVTEDENAVQFTTSFYPNIGFILDAEDYVGGWEELDNLTGEKNTLTISDFKENTKIKRIIINGKNE